MGNTSATIQEDSPQETRIQQSFENYDYIVSRLNAIKAEYEKQSTFDLNSNDKIKTCILEIAEYMESKYIEFGVSILIDQICVNITKLLEKRYLSHYADLAFKILPDKYKDPKKDRYKQAQKKLVKNKIAKIFKELEVLNITLLDPDDLYELKKNNTHYTDNIETVLKLKGAPLSPVEEGSNQLLTLDQLEKTKFKPAQIGKPLTTAEELCQDPLYKDQYDKLVKELNVAVKIAEFNREWFTVKYPPLSVEDCRELAQGIGLWNAWWKPYADKKYRRDHFQLAKIAMDKVQNTSVHASKESRIPCLWHVDKNGNAMLRGLTKEQIDAMYVYETNFLIEMVNHAINFGKIISDINAKHGGRAMEDRAIALHNHLSHHA